MINSSNGNLGCEKCLRYEFEVFKMKGKIYLRCLNCGEEYLLK